MGASTLVRFIMMIEGVALLAPLIASDMKPDSVDNIYLLFLNFAIKGKKHLTLLSKIEQKCCCVTTFYFNKTIVLKFCERNESCIKLF